MELLHNFNQISKSDTAIAGGKGASLGEMTKAGIPVPPGFVLLSSAFEKFLESADLNVEIDSILHAVDHKEMHTVENASAKIKDLILKAEMPKDIKEEIKKEFKNLNSQFVAVRSSATAEDSSSAAWAGQLDSFLNTTEKTLLENVQKCWASLFTPRAIFYRFEKGLHNSKISVAVVVQKMIDSESSGIAFSVHPVTEDRNQLIIEAGYGLGEAIVSGQITPDSYVVEKEPRQIIDKNISFQERGIYRKQKNGGNEWQNIPKEKGEQQKLTDEQILELSELIIKIENHYGAPQDIEWARENNQFYILQSRPITTLGEKTKIENIAEFEKVYTRDTTLIIQQGWHDVVTNAFKRKMGIKNPHLPPVIHYMNDGVIEVWENNASTKWFLDTLQSEISNNPKFIVSILDQYEKELEEIKNYWGGKVITSKREFKNYIDRVFEIMDGFVFMYYTAVDKRTPANIRNRALKMRDKDVYFYKNDKLIRSCLEKIYPELKGYATVILRAEIDNPPTLEVAKDRKKNFVMIGETEGIIITLTEYQSKHREYKFNIEYPPNDTNFLKGEIGNKGYVKGRVKIIKRKEQITEVQKGDIIVSPMTTPDFVPAMKKAGGIITDEGGITCHVAITSRELGIPCIIGTKFATQVLHDGDLVEVDADKGVVRIIKRVEEKKRKYLKPVDNDARKRRVIACQIVD